MRRSLACLVIWGWIACSDGDDPQLNAAATMPEPMAASSGGTAGSVTPSHPTAGSVPMMGAAGSSGSAAAAGGASGGIGAAGNAGGMGGRAGSTGNGGAGPMDGGPASASDAGDAGDAGSMGGAGDAASGACGSGSSDYDQTVLCDRPVGFWAMDVSSGNQETDLSGKGSTGTYEGPAPNLVAMPNGDQAANFNGSSNYLTVPSKAAFSIPTTGKLTWEAWIRPSTLQFPNDSGGYVDWMGKCADYSPTCEWEARMYSTDNSQDRCNRLSAYVFNPSAGLGSGADWQPECGLFEANEWLHVVAEYTTESQPANCNDAASYPGSISIWVNGVEWNHSRHGQTGCFSQYDVIPKANDSPVNIGTMAQDAWFQGAIGKVAIYDFLLSQTQITNHYRVMTGKAPNGSCQDTCSF